MNFNPNRKPGSLASDAVVTNKNIELNRRARWDSERQEPKTRKRKQFGNRPPGWTYHIQDCCRCVAMVFTIQYPAQPMLAMPFGQIQPQNAQFQQIDTAAGNMLRNFSVFAKSPVWP